MSGENIFSKACSCAAGESAERGCTTATDGSTASSTTSCATGESAERSCTTLADGSAASGATSRSSRESGIELLKIIAIFLIVLNHCIQSLTEAYLPDTSYVISISACTSSVRDIILMILRCSGNIANDIFIICSIWFFIGRKKNDKPKVVFLVIESFVISVLFFIVAAPFTPGITSDFILTQFFPVTNSNNWFVTCYILLLLTYPLLNRLIDVINQKTHIAITLIMLLLYSIIGCFRPWFISSGTFFVNAFIIWIMIYFLIAYIKMYLQDFLGNSRKCFICLVIGLAGLSGLIVATNLIGLHSYSVSQMLSHWNYAGNPFILLICIGAFGLLKKATFRSGFINYLSGLSLLTYLIHENCIFRYYYRPWIFYYIYRTFGYDHIILWLFLVTIAIFAASMLISAAFKETIERLLRPLSDVVYSYIARGYHCIERRIMKIR